MEKIWLKSYPSNTPAEIDVDTYPSLGAMLESNCKRYSQDVAFSNLGTTITYAELDKLSRDFAAYLQQGLELKKGDRIAIMLPNCLQYPVATYGALRAGLVVVNVNPLYTANELIHQLNDAEVNTIVGIANFAATIETALAKTP